MAHTKLLKQWSRKTRRTVCSFRVKPASLSAKAASLTHLKKNGKWSGSFLNTWIPSKRQNSCNVVNGSMALNNGGDKWGLGSYLPSQHVLSKLFIDDAANRHDEGVIWHLGSIVHPQVVFKVLAKRKKEKRVSDENPTNFTKNSLKFLNCTC